MDSVFQNNHDGDEEESLDCFLSVLDKIKLLTKTAEHHRVQTEATPSSHYQSEYYRIMKMRQTLRNKEDFITHMCEQVEELEQLQRIQQLEQRQRMQNQL